MNYKNKRIFLTGAAGFIGRHLVRALTDAGAHVHAFSGDLTNKNQVAKEVRRARPSIVFHLAADKTRSASIEAFNRAIDVNVRGSLNLFAALESLKGLQSIVVMGTAEEYGRNRTPFHEDAREAPVSSYSFSKLCLTRLCEVLAALHKMPFVVMRPTLAYGPGQDPDMFLPALIRALIKNKPFPMTPGRQTRDYLYIGDLINALCRAPFARIPAGTILNIGSGKPVEILKLARTVERLLGKKNLIKPGKCAYRPQEIMRYVTNNAAAARALKWKAGVSLNEGLRRTIAHYKYN